MKKALIPMLFFLISGAMLLASGQQPEAGAEAPGVSGQKTPIQIYNPGFAFPTEQIELTYWHVLEGRPGYHELANEIAAEYSAIHPNIRIDIRKIPNSQQRAIWATAFESRTAPDVAWMELQVGLLNKGLQVAPDWAGKMMEENFTEYALSLCQVSGNYYGWPGAEIDVGQMLYYRKDFYREVGLDPESPPEYFPEWLDAAKKLTVVDSAGNMTRAGVSLRYAGGHHGVGDKFSKYAAGFVDTRKHFYFNEDYTDVMFDDPGWIEAAQFFKDLVFTHKVTNTTLPIPIQAFGQGLAAMTNRETFFAGWLKENAPDADYGIGPLVSGKRPIGSFETGAMPWLGIQSVTVDSKHPDLAWDFNMFFMQPENEIRIVKNNGGMSRLEAHQDDPFFKTLPYYDVYNYMISERPLVRSPYQDPNALVAEIEAKTGEAAVELMTNPNSDPRKLMLDLAEYGRQRFREINK
jgi:multiple sugar transport system substrate-binding protein